jgi:two-component system, OmpR family, response regulator
VLVVDEETATTDLVALALRDDGFTMERADSGYAALTAVARFNPDLVILEMTLPDLSGLEVLRRLSAEGRQVPMIFLTTRDRTEDKVNGLTFGADDYMTKPFSVEELLARVRVVLSRYGSAADGGLLTLADLLLDEHAHEVRRAGELIELTRIQYRMLRYLLVNAGQVLTRDQILDHVWDYDLPGSGHVLETHISCLRRKVDRLDPPLIRTVRGVGYVIQPPG